jgi:hypothetical protein
VTQLVSIGLALGLLLIGCGGPDAPPAASPSKATPSPPGPNDVERFLPLRDGFVLSYRVWLPGRAEPEQVIFQVERRSTTHVSLRSGNSAKQLELAADGVRLVTGGYLLKAPLAPGAEWTGPIGRVRVTATERSIDVSAGHFEGCLETTESAPDGSGGPSVVTAYCPDVGIAEIRVSGADGEQRFELRSFGPRVDIDAL